MQQFAFISNLITTITIFAQLHERPVCIAHYKTKVISELLPSVKLWRCLNKTVIIKLWTLNFFGQNLLGLIPQPIYEVIIEILWRF